MLIPQTSLGISSDRIILDPSVSPIFIIRTVLPHQFLDRVSPDKVFRRRDTKSESDPKNLSELGSAEKFSNLSFSITGRM